MQVIHIFEHIAFHGSRYRNIINQAFRQSPKHLSQRLGGQEARGNTPPQMDHIFAKPNAASMRTDWHSEPKKKLVPRSGMERRKPRKKTSELWIRANGPELEDLMQVHRKQRALGAAAHFVAMRSTLSTSLTPARRHESIWQTSIASAWKSCLNTIRLCACSPVATPIPCGFSARRMAACPRISSGAVGSSMNLVVQ
jgi:hypothetical protein